MARRDDDAPWLAEADGDTRATTAVPRGRVIGGLVLFLLLVALVVVGVFVIVSKKEDGASGVGVTRAEDAPLITADPGPYKVAPDDAGGMQVDESGITQQQTGGGQDEPGNIAIDRAPEEPEPRPGTEPVSILPESQDLPAIPPASGTAAAKPAAPAAALAVKPAAPVPAPATKPAAPAVVTVAPPPPKPKPAATAEAPAKASTTGAGTTLQLGAFSTAGKAEQAWKSLTGRYTWLAELNKRIEPVERDTGTLYRLRATGSADTATAAANCAKLKVAGEACVVTP
jgi:cell division septation protein DedD